jgi:uncharacterized membrane protein YeiB
MAQHKPAPIDRLDGLDLARFIALVGMVIVNFDYALANLPDGTPDLTVLTGFLNGRAAATFVVLAGVGMGLMSMRYDRPWFKGLIFRRSLFLLGLGIINLQFFTDDILHFYAFYFLCALPLLDASRRVLILTIIALIGGYLIQMLVLDPNYADVTSQLASFTGLLTLQTFSLDLLVDGLHPIIPWLAFFLFGIMLSRLPLHDRKVQLWLFWAGLIAYENAELLSYALIASSSVHPGAVFLFSTASSPPMPIYMLAGGGAASAVIGASLLVAPLLRKYRVLQLFTTPGRQSLTLYVAHVAFAVAVLPLVFELYGQTDNFVFVVSAMFCLLAIVFALVWSRFFRRGPMEILMRRLTDQPLRLSKVLQQSDVQRLFALWRQRYSFQKQLATAPCSPPSDPTQPAE